MRKTKLPSLSLWAGWSDSEKTYVGMGGLKVLLWESKEDALYGIGGWPAYPVMVRLTPVARKPRKAKK